jgi:hypothetical protein
MLPGLDQSFHEEPAFSDETVAGLFKSQQTYVGLFQCLRCPGRRASHRPSVQRICVSLALLTRDDPAVRWCIHPNVVALPLCSLNCAMLLTILSAPHSRLACQADAWKRRYNARQTNTPLCVLASARASFEASAALQGAVMIAHKLYLCMEAEVSLIQT